MGIAAANEHAVLFNEAEAWSGFAGAGESVGVASGSDKGEEARGS